MLAHHETMAPLFLHQATHRPSYAPPSFMNHFLDERFNTASTSNSCMLPQANNNSAQPGQQQQPSTSRMSVAQVQQQQQPQQGYGAPMRNAAMPSASASLMGSASQSPQQMNGNALYNIPIKSEPIYDGMYDASDNDSHYSSGTTSGGRLMGHDMNKPRKYRIKPECERKKPEYKVKRAKNNDAVRRSRDKAKRMQQEKEQRLEFLEKQHADSTKLVANLQKRVNDMERELLRVRTQCSCGSAINGVNGQSFLRR